MEIVTEPSVYTDTSKPRKIAVKKLITYIALTLVSLIMILPFVWMLSASLKAESEIFGFPIKWIPETFHWSNYKEVWTRVPFHIYYLNTLKISVITTFLLVINSSLAGYAFAKIKFPENNILFFIYIATMMIPYQVMMIPQFMLMSEIGLVNSHWALILLGSFNPFGVFLFRQFFLSIPDELLEAARIDGLSEFGIYRKIIMPLSKPVIATLVIFTFMHAWNDFLGPLIYLTSDHLYTLQLGIQHFVTEYNTEYSLLMAAAVSAIVPTILVYFLAQDHFIKGVANTGIKG
ncbi:sugar ABC transporter ATP-binding protein [Bacillus canaveralius]|uniref:Sugar ABC transporter ATP-binding protein n=1 Tax=Bacillus canaveralius TaxID=1403243 RepID=A0A2N5GS44_9BACI|nr:carbohydrate ABC transporter permease [Bacillus canaveralius]PLR86375.1 sugar ABC transporter ATP-binding protein [Bacillus canaveralius]PLR98608.1 sugar ABC transporter ATP-binding protein [Bacillus canaveralius]